MSVVVFLGPTLPVDQARSHLDAEYLPPVKQGDVLRVLARRPTAIGIVDGYFDTVPAVWHKEILLAMARGVHVFGAASMGALRAAELDAFGMVGVGRIFDMFCHGELEDDDEVAVAHGPADTGFRPMSDAMVDIRDAIEAATRAGVVADPIAEQLVASAKGLYYPERSWPRVLALAGASGHDPRQLDELRTFLSTYGPTLKQRDALALLDHLAAFIAGSPSPLRISYEVQRTTFLDTAAMEVEQELAAGVEIMPPDPATVLRVGETLPGLRKKVLLQLLANREASRIGLSVTLDEVDAMLQSFCADYGLTTAERLLAWLDAEQLPYERLLGMMRDFCVVLQLERLYDREISRGVPDQIRVSSARGLVSSTPADLPPDGEQSPTWMQMNVALRAVDGSLRPSARAVFAAVCPLLDEWRRDRQVQAFHFMRKPPDLRLRFAGRDLERRVVPELTALLERLRQEGSVERCFRTPYEPEARQFGGPPAMDLVHRYFDVDSRGWIAMDQAWAAGRATLRPEVVVAAVMNDLILRTLGDSSEVWDTWCNFQELQQPSPELLHLTDTPESDILLIDSVIANARADEQAILRRYARANARLATGFTRLWSQGRLQHGLRAILPFVVMFQCNRYGIGGDDQAQLARAQVAAWNPKRGMRGAEKR